MYEEDLNSQLANPGVRWAAVLAITLLGAVWLLYKGPVPVVRVTTPMQETAPFWYMVSAFPVFGMLVADLLSLSAHYGLACKTVELGFQIGVLVFVSNARLALRLPISGHSLLFAYFILRRVFIPVPSHGFARLECMVAVFLFAVTSYVKIVWWSDPVTVMAGIVFAVGLAAISFFVLKVCG